MKTTSASMKPPKSFGAFIAEKRAALGFSLKDLARCIHKDDGHSVSAQYLHDMERDRRMPSATVLGEIAKALGVDANVLTAIAGQAPPDVLDYLKAHPWAATALAQAARRAAKSGTTDWSAIG